VAVQSILFIELMGGIGDLVIALPAIRALAHSHPQATVTVLTFFPGGTLLEGQPFVTEVIYATRSKSRSDDGAPQRRDVEELLSNRKFDIIVSDTMYGGIDRLVENSWATYRVSNLWRHPPENELVGDRFLRILESERLVHADPTVIDALLTVPETARDLATAWRRHNLPGDLPFAILNPDAGMPIKRWQPDKFVAVGKSLSWRYNLRIVVLGGEDVEMASSVARNIHPTALVLPKLNLPEFAGIAAQAALFISSDTGPARIAAAVGTPTIALYGPTSAARYGLKAPHAYSSQCKRPVVVNIQSPRACSERNPLNFTLQSCWYSGCCVFHGIANCVDDIAVESVIHTAQEILEGKHA